MQKKKSLIEAPNIGEMRSFPKEQEVAIFQNFAAGNAKWPTYNRRFLKSNFKRLVMLELQVG